MPNNERLISLDAFRGFTIAAMILVNNPGDWNNVFAPLLHKDWHGITVTDLIFPFFLFIVGVSIALAYTKRVEAGAPKGDMYQKIVFRSLKIFAVGLLLNLFPMFNFGELRVAGVLQRIAIVFLFSAFFFLNFKWKRQAIIGGAILVLYWLAMVLIPTPGYGKAMLEPGINLAAYLDSFLLPGKMWQGTWDPEGLLSTIPAIATGISGLLAGTLLVSRKPQEEKIIWLFVAGFIALSIGHAWSWFFPINKNIWTSSFVMVTSGLALLTLATVIYLVDVRGFRKIAHPGVVFGSNAITIYVLADVFSFFTGGIKLFGASMKQHLLDLFYVLGATPKFSSLLYAILLILLLYIPAWWLHRKKIFIKL